jgi:hypothetical protein
VFHACNISTFASTGAADLVQFSQKVYEKYQAFALE